MALVSNVLISTALVSMALVSNVLISLAQISLALISYESTSESLKIVPKVLLLNHHLHDIHEMVPRNIHDS